MPIIGIEGNIGSGKSVALTYFGLEEYFLLKKPIFSNFHLKGNIPHKVISFEDLIDMATRKVELKRAAILLDEAHIWIDSRTSASKLSRVFTYFVLQTGKQDINLYWASQRLSQVDLRLRQQTDIAVNVTKKNEVYHVLNMVNTHTGAEDKQTIYGPDVYPFYDTHEIIAMGRTAEARA